MNIDAFISYSHKDRKIIDALIESLEKDISIFIDRENIELGNDWKEKVELGIDGSLCTIVFITKNSIVSKAILYELNTVNEQLELDNEYKLLIIYEDENIDFRSIRKEILSSLNDEQKMISRRICTLLMRFENCISGSITDKSLYFKIGNFVRKIRPNTCNNASNFDNYVPTNDLAKKKYELLMRPSYIVLDPAYIREEFFAEMIIILKEIKFLYPSTKIILTSNYQTIREKIFVNASETKKAILMRNIELLNSCVYEKNENPKGIFKTWIREAVECCNTICCNQKRISYIVKEDSTGLKTKNKCSNPSLVNSFKYVEGEFIKISDESYIKESEKNNKLLMDAISKRNVLVNDPIKSKLIDTLKLIQKQISILDLYIINPKELNVIDIDSLYIIRQFWDSVSNFSFNEALNNLAKRVETFKAINEKFDKARIKKDLLKNGISKIAFKSINVILHLNKIRNISYITSAFEISGSLKS